MHKRIISALLVLLLAISLLPAGFAAPPGNPSKVAPGDIRHAFAGGDPFAHMTDELVEQAQGRLLEISGRMGGTQPGGALDDIPERSYRLEDPRRGGLAGGFDRYIVKYKGDAPGAAQGFKAQLATIAFDAKTIGTASLAASSRTDGQPAMGGGPAGGMEVLVLGEPILPSALAGELRSRGAGQYIEYIQPDYVLSLDSLGQTPDEPTLAGADEYDEDPSGPSGQPAPQAAPVLAAVIDTGLDPDHPMLAGRASGGGWNFPAGSDEIYDPGRPMESAHGLHVAGLISGAAERAGADVAILPLKVFQNGIAYTSDILSAIAYAESLGAGVINCSFGSTAENQALYEAIAGSGALFVCAAGNSRRDLAAQPSYPANYGLPNVLSVGSTNADGGYSYFSNYGPVDIAALGRDVVSALPGGKAGKMSGTSQAAGAVTGAAASALSLAGAAGAADLRDRLLHAADRLDNLYNKVIGGRRLNLGNALAGAQGAQLSPNPADDYDAHGYDPRGGSLYELFSSSGGAVQVSSGTDHTLALMADGSVLAWGYNSYGQCGTGDTLDCGDPTPVIGLADIVGISAGACHSLAVDSSGAVYAWGANWIGQLGDGTYTDRLAPVQVAGLAGVAAISAGYEHSLALDDSGAIWAWGSNWYMQLGMPEYYYDSPYPGETFDPVPDAAAIGTGEHHGYAVTTAGDLYVWGRFDRKEGWSSDNYTPRQIDTGQEVLCLAEMAEYALLGDGSICGICGFWDQCYMVAQGPVDAVAITSQMALRDDGSVWDWNIDEEVGGLADIIGIASEWYGTNYAVQDDGTLWAWDSGAPPHQMLAGSLEPPEPTSMTVAVNPSNLTIPASGTETAQAIATVKDQYGKAMPNQAIAYSLPNAPIAGVGINSSTGEIEVTSAAQPGPVTVKAISGSLSATTELALADEP
ncbi:MAG: S8 family serine peptidase, partial [Oscillospiraceae bacterium]|nr:S8 family serine peptidase [Oscillospiraceae bacterium]